MNYGILCVLFVQIEGVWFFYWRCLFIGSTLFVNNGMKRRETLLIPTWVRIPVFLLTIDRSSNLSCSLGSLWVFLVWWYVQYILLGRWRSWIFQYSLKIQPHLSEYFIYMRDVFLDTLHVYHEVVNNVNHVIQLNLNRMKSNSFCNIVASFCKI